MSSGLEVISHPTGPWLVRAGKAVFSVPGQLGAVLQTWHGQRPTAAELTAHPAPRGTDPEQWLAFMATLATALAGGGQAHGQRLPPPIWLRLVLLPAAVVGPLARAAVPLVSGRGFTALGVMGLAGYGHLAWAAAANPIRTPPGALGLGIGLFLLTALWHEIGHAAAISRHGYPPGSLGLGLLFVIPVLFADVTPIGVLPRRERLRVDAAGIVFQFGCGGILASLGAVTGGAPVVASWLAVLAISWSLFPFVRADGYWLVCDLLGVESLEVDPDPAPAGWRRWVLSFYRLTNSLFLLAVGFLLPLHYAQRGSAWLAQREWDLSRPEIVIPLGLVLVAGLGFVWWNILRRVARLLRAVVHAHRS